MALKSINQIAETFILNLDSTQAESRKKENWTEWGKIKISGKKNTICVWGGGEVEKKNENK